MGAFEVGDVVQVTGRVMTGNVGVVVSFDEKRRRCLVRVSDQIQNWFDPEDLQIFAADR